MTKARAVDYLGHPCKTTEAFALFADEVTAARNAAKAEPRNIARGMGKELLNLFETGDRIHDALEAALHSLPNDGDCDRTKAVLELLLPAARTLISAVAGHAGTALVALELSGLIGAAQKEVEHG